MDITKKIINIVIVFFTIVMTFTSLLYAYFLTIGKSKIPSAITSTYATTVTNPLTKEELPVLQANYYANKNKSGYEVVEFKVNSYSGVSKQAIYARGFQMVWDKNGKIVQYQTETMSSPSNVWYYDTFESTSFETGHVYKFGDKMVIDIDGKTYAVALDGKYEVPHRDFNTGKLIRTIGLLGLNLIFEDTNYYNEYTTKEQYTFEDLLLKIKSIIKSSSNGTGNSIIPLIDLGDFLHIYEYDENNGQFKNEPVGGKTSNVLINSYFTMSTRYDNRGMAWTKQSMFGSVAGDNEFNITGLETDVDYWKATTQYNLSEQDFESRYSSADNGFYYILPTSLISELKGYENLEINITFNVSNLNVNVLGFDYYALNGIEVNSLTITSKNQRDFRLLVGSLKNTGLTSADIHTENISLINTNSGVVI